MKDLLPAIDRWRQVGRRMALATVVRTVGSSPRQAGSRMVVTETGEMAGSVSGGCVEGAVVEVALQVLESGKARLLHFGVSDEEAWAVGLSCGGTIQVLVEPLEPSGGDPELGGPGPHPGGTDPDPKGLLDLLFQVVREGQVLAVATELPPVEGGGGEETSPAAPAGGAGSLTGRIVLEPQDSPRGTLSSPDASEVVEGWLNELLDGAPGGIREANGQAYFLERIEPDPRLVIVGAVHIAVALARMAREVGFRVSILDARQRFASPERFPDVDELVVGWPQEILPQMKLDERSYVVVITHDAKLDNPALEAALASPAPYVGALGSRRTHARRVEALRAAGVDEEALGRIHAPIGLDIGARTPAEIALATLAEIIAVRNGAAGAVPDGVVGAVPDGSAGAPSDGAPG